MGGLSSKQDVTVFLNGHIYQSPTNNTDNPTFASCMVIRHDSVQYIGSEKDAAVVAAIQSGAVIQDLNGQTVLPGFIDGHLHLLLVGQSLTKLSLDACRNLQDIETEIRKDVQSHPHVSRIFCRGWMHSMTPEGVDATLLDGIDPRPNFVDTCTLPGATPVA
ncbi:amidohydrolase family protein [Metarhizium rileyi]|uniref:Amidohydrolase family protein n=1 Tax=Metarhizium rileyi (strain RCEF 4871) TaxID=1649241 RepID=A0A166ZX06_METRR|nr:amidohydrolase family protein [Metarhizium rileyi RCEF 4871]